MGLEHLSYSSISKYMRCPRQWYYHYIEQRPTSPSAALINGSATHNTIERMWYDTQTDILDIWEQEWTRCVDEARGEIDWGDKDEMVHYEDGLRVIKSPSILPHIRAIQPRSELDVERKVELHVPEVPVPIIGYIDVIDAREVPGDIKTSSRAWSQKRADDSLQPTFYLAALWQAGVPVTGEFRYYILTKTKSPKYQMIQTHRHRGHVDFLFEIIQGVWRGIENLVFYPQPDGWHCDPRYCDFYKDCMGKASESPNGYK